MKMLPFPLQNAKNLPDSEFRVLFPSQGTFSPFFFQRRLPLRNFSLTVSSNELISVPSNCPISGRFPILHESREG